MGPVIIAILLSRQSSVVSFDNEIHILCGTNNRTAHYKFNGTDWVEVSTLPYNHWQSAATVYNNEIHIMGGYSGSYKHYKFNGTDWIEASTLPTTAQINPMCCVNNDSLYNRFCYLVK